MCFHIRAEKTVDKTILLVHIVLACLLYTVVDKDKHPQPQYLSQSIDSSENRQSTYELPKQVF